MPDLTLQNDKASARPMQSIGLIKRTLRLIIQLHAPVLIIIIIVNYFSTGTNRIFDITVGEVRDTSATIVCELACFTEEIGCIPVDTNLTFHTSNITGRSCSYSYHSQNITFSNLASGNTYNVCISAYNLTTTELQGSVQCEIFTTPHYHDEGTW